jgi:hypothetical protein
LLALGSAVELVQRAHGSWHYMLYGSFSLFFIVYGQTGRQDISDIQYTIQEEVTCCQRKEEEYIHSTKYSFFAWWMIIT